MELAPYTDEQIAEAIHVMNGLLQKWAGEEPQPGWEDAPPAMRHRVLMLVRGYRNGITPRTAHERWCGALLADGWRYGPVKDAQAKTHPNLVEWRYLPLLQRRKDQMSHGLAAQMVTLDAA